ncbi:hypothetical protein GW17_00007436 [Ensete ventricosum]|nr:hypothetical protein GW17_00007436 [Ensete ventricosum]
MGVPAAALAVTDVRMVCLLHDGDLLTTALTEEATVGRGRWRRGRGRWRNKGSTTRLGGSTEGRGLRGGAGCGQRRSAVSDENLRLTGGTPRSFIKGESGDEQEHHRREEQRDHRSWNRSGAFLATKEIEQQMLCFDGCDWEEIAQESTPEMQVEGSGSRHRRKPWSGRGRGGRCDQAVRGYGRGRKQG